MTRGRSLSRTPSRSRSRSGGSIFRTPSSLVNAAANAGAAYAAEKVTKLAARSGPSWRTHSRQFKKTKLNRMIGSKAGMLQGVLPGKFKRVGRRAHAGNSIGITESRETGGVIDAGISTTTQNNTVFVGHATCAQLRVSLCVFRALVKKLMVKAEQDVTDFLVPYSASAPNLIGCQVLLTLSNIELGGVPRVYTYTIVGGTNHETVATYFHDQYRGDSTVNRSLYPSEISLVDNVNYAIRVNLMDCMVHINCKSNLKMQNRTVAAAGDDEEDVDNIPLSGKGFSGNGTGCTGAAKSGFVYTTAASEFACDNQSGAIAKVPAELQYQDIVKPSAFVRVTGGIKIRLNPGDIKTSTLYYKRSIRLYELFKILYDSTAASAINSNPLLKIGKFRFFQFEKVMNTVAGTAANSIKVAYEVNNVLTVGVTIKRRTYTAQINTVGIIANEQ